MVAYVRVVTTMILPYEKYPRDCIFSNPFSGTPRHGLVQRCRSSPWQYNNNRGMHRVLTVPQVRDASPTVKTGAIACCLRDGVLGDDLCVSWVWHKTHGQRKENARR